MKRLLPFAIIAIVLVGVGAWVWYLNRSTSGSARPTISPVAGGTGAVATASPEPGAEPPHVRGDANAPVTLEEFGDFQCPPCGAFYPILKTAEADYGSRLRVIFRELPLPQIHPHALAAADAAEAAGLQGKFWEMHDVLYENQATWDKAFDARPLFDDMAKKIGLDVARFKQDEAGPVVDTRVTRDGIRAHSLSLAGTPSVLINNQEIPFEQFRTPEGLHAAIDAALKKTKP